MARPIDPTPILTGKDAENLRKEIEETSNPSSRTIRRLEAYASMYKRFSARGNVDSDVQPTD